jgi:hypothetical protein
MSKFKVTTQEYKGETTNVLAGSAKLISLPSAKVFELNNANKTKYRLATIEIVTPTGQVSQMPTQIFQTSLDNIKEAGGEFTIGIEYLTTIRGVQDPETNKMKMFATTSSAVNSMLSEVVNDELALMLGQFEPAETASKRNVEITP